MLIVPKNLYGTVFTNVTYLPALWKAFVLWALLPLDQLAVNAIVNTGQFLGTQHR